MARQEIKQLPVHGVESVLLDEETVDGDRADELVGRHERRAGSAEVSIANSGPPGADVCVRARLGGGDLRDSVKALGVLGIEVAV